MKNYIHNILAIMLMLLLLIIFVLGLGYLVWCFSTWSWVDIPLIDITGMHIRATLCLLFIIANAVYLENL